MQRPTDVSALVMPSCWTKLNIMTKLHQPSSLYVLCHREHQQHAIGAVFVYVIHKEKPEIQLMVVTIEISVNKATIRLTYDCINDSVRLLRLMNFCFSLLLWFAKAEKPIRAMSPTAWFQYRFYVQFTGVYRHRTHRHDLDYQHSLTSVETVSHPGHGGLQCFSRRQLDF